MIPSGGTVTWAPLARSDLDRQIAYVALFDMAAAARIRRAVDDKVLWVARFPLAGPLLPGGRRKARVSGTRLVVVYRPHPDGIRISRIFHERQDWR